MKATSAAYIEVINLPLCYSVRNVLQFIIYFV